MCEETTVARSYVRLGKLNEVNREVPWFSIWQHSTKIGRKRPADRALWNETLFKGFPQTNNAACNTWWLKNGWILFHKLKRWISLSSAVQNRLIFHIRLIPCKTTSAQLWPSVLSPTPHQPVLIDSVHASLHLPAHCCITIKGIWAQNKPRWGQTADLQQRKVVLCLVIVCLFQEGRF